MSDIDAPPDASEPAHPDSILRLSSAVHRFRIPYINPADQLSYEESFKTCSSSHRNTTLAMQQADLRRDEIKQAFAAGHLSHATMAETLKEYLPLINQILTSCKFQPEVAQLDKKLLFSWASGIEHNKGKRSNYFNSEALMFELVMSIATYALSESNIGCDSCINGEFPQASRQFSKAAGAFKYLGDELLPSWMAKSQQHAKMDKDALAETRVGVCVAFTSLHMAMAQQMAVGTILVKPGVPNYALVGKLCLGTAEECESFVNTLRSKSAVHMSRMDPSFLTLITFEINVQRALSLYFLARSLWTSGEHGVAISALSEATVAMRTRTSPTGRGLPEIEPNGPLASLTSEVIEFRRHIATLLNSWEKDNSLVYFDKVPPSVPANNALKAIQLKKVAEFSLEMKDPLPFSVPGIGVDDTACTLSATGGNTESDAPPSYDQAMINDSRLQPARERSDSDLARELHAKLNTE